MANKGLTVKVAPDEIMYSSISKSRDGYNSARLVSKISDNVYMNISVEWESSETIPSFAMDLMNTLKASKIKSGKVVEEYEEEFAGIKDRVLN